MFVFGNLMEAVATVINTALTIYMWIIIARAIISWVNPDPYNPIVRGIRTLTEPVFYRIRKWLPFTYISGIDFSPFVVVLGIKFVQVFLARLMSQMMF